MQKAKLGDLLQVNLSDSDKPNWIQFWNHPLRDNEDIAHAQRILDSGGMCFYSQRSFRREFRIISPTNPAPDISLDELEV